MSDKLTQAGISLRGVVEEAMATPTTRVQYPSDDPVVTKSRDLLSMTLMRLIVRDPRKSPAYKLGLVDANGHTIKIPETSEEREALNSIERLAFTLRGVIGGTRANGLKYLVTDSGSPVEDVTQNLVVFTRGMDRGAVETYLKKMDGKKK